MLHHGKTKLRRGAALSPHVVTLSTLNPTLTLTLILILFLTPTLAPIPHQVTLSTFGMLAAKEVVPPAEATDAPGWHVKRRAVEDGVKRSLLHLRCWRRLVVSCSDPNPDPNP